MDVLSVSTKLLSAAQVGVAEVEVATVAVEVIMPVEEAHIAVEVEDIVSVTLNADFDNAD